MLKSKLFVLAAIFTLIVAACAPGASLPATPTNFPPVRTEEPSVPVSGMAVVQSVEVQIVRNSPLQVNAIARGQLPDIGCTSIAGASQVRTGNSITVTLTTTTDPLAICAQALTPFEYLVALDVKDLPAGETNVSINGIKQVFQVIADLDQFKQALVDTLNARNYDSLKTFMNQSLLIAYHRSEGTSYDVNAAIEQLKLNHLSAASPITPDPNKDLNTLASGLDPLSIFGLDVGPNLALFVSGWGPDGKDEATLYVNYKLDGTLYWHGVLVARGGFAQSAGGANESVQETVVQYVMAQLDVPMYSGPGAQYGLIGSVAHGQVAKVTGLSADGNWWRVICPDDTVGSCWVSASTSYTQPTQSP